MNREEAIAIDSSEAIRIINRDNLLTTLLRVSDAGHRSLVTAESSDGRFLGVFSGENYVDRNVMVSEYQGSPEDSHENGFWVYDRIRDLVAFHSVRCREGRQYNDERMFLWGLSDDVKRHMTPEEIIKAEGNPAKFELRAFQPGDWQRHVQFIEKNLGYNLKPSEDFLGAVKINEIYEANCFVHS